MSIKVFYNEEELKHNLDGLPPEKDLPPGYRIMARCMYYEFVTAMVERCWNPFYMEMHYGAVYLGVNVNCEHCTHAKYGRFVRPIKIIIEPERS